MLAVEVYLRKRRFLLVLQALKRAFAFSNPSAAADLHVALQSFLHSYQQYKDSVPAMVREVIDAELKTVEFGAGKSVREQNQAYLKANEKNFACRLAGEAQRSNAGGISCYVCAATFSLSLLHVVVTIAACVCCSCPCAALVGQTAQRCCCCGPTQ